MTARILIAGLGNRLMADDGVGPVVIDRLHEARLPDGVRLLEAGTDATRLPSLWNGERMVWLIDAITHDAAAGTVHRLDHAALMDLNGNHLSAHRLSLPECLRWIAHSYPEFSGVEYRLWGIEAGIVEAASRLSPEVASSVDVVVREIVDCAVEIRGDSCD